MRHQTTNKCSVIHLYLIGEKSKNELSYLISTLKASFCCLAPALHSINEDAETFLLTSEKTEGQWSLPGRLGQCHQPWLGFSSTCYV